jgi:excisionase family DNA binding protein
MPALLTETGAARLLALTTNDVRRLVRRGEIPTVELPNGEIRFDGEDLRRWAATFRRTPVICRPVRETVGA